MGNFFCYCIVVSYLLGLKIRNVPCQRNFVTNCSKCEECVIKVLPHCKSCGDVKIILEKMNHKVGLNHIIERWLNLIADGRNLVEFYYEFSAEGSGFVCACVEKYISEHNNWDLTSELFYFLKGEKVLTDGWERIWKILAEKYEKEIRKEMQVRKKKEALE